MRTVAFLIAWLLSPVPEGVAMDIVAHRGASADAPENTLASIRLGYERGADAAECDVHLTSDGRIAVIHDPDTLRTTGQGLQVARTPWARLSTLDAGAWKGERFADERIPLLATLLAAIPDGKRLLVEIKCGPEIIAPLVKLLDASGRADRVWIIGFDLDVVTAAKRALPEVPVLYLAKSPKGPDGKPVPHDAGLVDVVRSHGLDGLGLHHAGVTAGIVAAAHAAGQKVYVWTVDDPAQARRLQAMGVDGLITNRPGWMRKQLEGEGKDR